MTFKRLLPLRALWPAAVIASTSLLPSVSLGQPLADRSPLKIVVPFAAGTPTDSIARTLGQSLTRSLSRPVVIDNRPGAAGGIGTEHALKAPADGQTLLLTVNSTVTINPLIYSKLKYDPLKDLAPLAQVATGGYLLVASPQSGLRSVESLVKAAKLRPGFVNFASYGPGSMSHMCAEVFQAMAGVKLFHVPYKAGSLNDILGGQVEVGFEPVGPTIAHVQSGRLLGLASTTSSRVGALPEVPSLSDSFAGYDCTAWVGVMVPARTPLDVRRALEEQILSVARTSEFAQQMTDLGLTARPAGSDAFAKVIRLDHERWAQVVRPLGLKLD